MSNQPSPASSSIGEKAKTPSALCGAALLPLVRTASLDGKRGSKANRAIAVRSTLGLLIRSEQIYEHLPLEPRAVGRQGSQGLRDPLRPRCEIEPCQLGLVIPALKIVEVGLTGKLLRSPDGEMTQR